MTRWIAAAVVAVVYVALLGWVVSNEGNSYRKSLADSRKAAPSVASAPPVEPPEETSPPSAESASAPLLASSEPQKKGPRRKGATPKTKAHPPREAPHTEAVAKTPAPPEKAKTAAKAATPMPPPAPAMPTEAEKWADGLDLAHLSPDDERRLGRELNAVILGSLPPLPNAPELEQVIKAARPFLSGRDASDYQFIIVDSSAVEAFSHPGGYVYLTRGLFDAIGNVGEDGDGQYDLEFLLAHEIAHLNAKDAIKLVTANNQEAKKAGIGTLLQFLPPIVVGFPDKEEYAADDWAFDQMTRLDRSRRKTLGFLRKFRGYAEAHEFRNGRQAPLPGLNPLENHYRSLPAPWQRLERLEKRGKPGS